MRNGKGGQVVVSIRGFFIELLKRGACANPEAGLVQRT